MKKIFSLLVIAGFTALVACGPSAEEKAAAEKMRQDSIQAVMDKMAADSIAAVQAANEKMMQDSLAAMAAKADSMAAVAAGKPAKKPVKAKTAEEKKEEKVQEVTGGRGRK